MEDALFACGIDICHETVWLTLGFETLHFSRSSSDGQM
jgi:hypothetical protein